ncbi:phospholipid methyltransferase [Nitrospirillum sp. BR 11163]|uniref:class I SAM-dependent methyltransferase n=1 Tax=Nitrospirillum sp. BR 11163 TaxID=3104323 RepID=UPI002AFFE7BE|nr:phospholipid methyltransferase [Nitrospirillum sp. BR 11163]MEA1674941.1 phospholipid methyltransferase [Nitrospirillum sp. BR 11163]
MPTDRAETTLNGKKFAARGSAKSCHPRGHSPRAQSPANENPAWLFFRRWAANPVSIASITPSAPSLGRLMARHVRREADEIVVEYGGGTGAITKALLDSGIPASRLFVIERDKELHAYMTAKFPGVTVLLGDVKDVRSLLPPQWVGKVGTIVCGIPMILIPAEAQRLIMDEAYAVMPKGRQFLSFTYSLRSPLRRQALHLSGKRLGWAVSNIPPAAVWGYTRD